MSEIVIDVQHLNKTFGHKTVVRDVSIQIAAGEIFGFLGANGSGKTTSMRMMCGLLTPDSGTGTCLGYDIIREHKHIKPYVGYMTQRFSFWGDLSIRENLMFTAKAYRLPKAKQLVDQVLAQLGLTARQHQLTAALSGGWKQRLALACCVIRQPRLLLLDEPTAGVDPTARRDFWLQIHRLAAEGVAILVSTHYMDEAERCYKLAYVSHGALLITGTATQIIAQQQLATIEITTQHQDFPLFQLVSALNRDPATAQVVVFGQSLHLNTKDIQRSQESLLLLQRYHPIHFRVINTSLEDVFIYLMSQSGQDTRA